MTIHHTKFQLDSSKRSRVIPLWKWLQQKQWQQQRWWHQSWLNYSPQRYSVAEKNKRNTGIPSGFHSKGRSSHGKGSQAQWTKITKKPMNWITNAMPRERNMLPLIFIIVILHYYRYFTMIIITFNIIQKPLMNVFTVIIKTYLMHKLKC